MSVNPKIVSPKQEYSYPKILPQKIKWLSKEHLKRTFTIIRSTAGGAPGADGVNIDSFTELEWDHRINKLATAIRKETFKVGPTRLVPVAKEPGGFREIQIYNLIDRIASKACSDVIDNAVDKGFEDFSYGFRRGRGIHDVFAKISNCYSEGMKDVITFDVVKAFDSIPLRQLSALIEQLKIPAIAKALANEVIRGTKDRNRLIGISQGNALSGLFFNMYMDRYFDQEIKNHLTEEVQLFRYVDDIVIVGANKEAAAKLHDICSNVISKKGLKIAKIQISNLETESIEVLGLTLCSDRDKISYRLTESSWTKLSSKLEEAHLHPDPPTSLTRTISGWKEANKLVSWSEGYQLRLDELMVKHGIHVKPMDIED